MERNVKTYLWTFATIEEEWEEKGVEKEKNIRRRFETFLMEELGFSEEEMSWFRTKTSNEQGGQFIFGFRDEDTPTEMKKLLCIEKKGYITSKEKDELIQCLIALLPIYRNVDAFKDLKKAVKSNEEFKFEKVWDEENRTFEKEKRMAEIVEEYYKKNKKVELFVHVDGTKIYRKSVQRSIYCYQYNLICEWALKWYFIMQNVEAVKIAERYDNGNKECKENAISKQEEQIFYITGKIENVELAAIFEKKSWIETEELCECAEIMFEEQRHSEEKLQDLIQELQLIKSEKEVNTEDNCRECCTELINKITKYNLKETAEDVYEYIIEKAYEELEEISEKVRKRVDEEFYCETVKGRERADIEKLHKVRMMIENKKKKRKTVVYIPKINE